jgi:hypothetical protein
VCRDCRWVGDVVELYAATQKQSLNEAAAALVLDQLISVDPEDLATYLADRARNALLIGLLREGQEYASQNPGSLRGLLQAFDCFFHDQHAPAFARYHGLVRGQDILALDIELSKEAERVIRHMGKWSCLAIPVWTDARLIGLWLLHDKAFDQQYEYLDFTNEQGLPGLGYGDHVSPLDELVFCTSDPRVAVRMMSRQVSERRVIAVFGVPAPSVRFRGTQLSARQVIFYHCQSGPTGDRFMLEGARFGGADAQILLDSQLRINPLTQWPEGRTVVDTIRLMRQTAQPPYQALAQYLLCKTKQDATRVALSWHLDLQEQAKVLVGREGEDFIFLKRALDADMKSQSIQFDDHTINETPQGWYCEGKLISSATMRIDEVVSDRATGTAYVSGTVSFQSDETHQIVVIPFREEMKTLERNTADWLGRFCLAHGGWIRCDSKWSKRLLHIGRKFSQSRMTITTTDKPLGWSRDGVLRLPRFLVDQNGIQRVANRVDGPDPEFPTQLTTMDGDALKDRDTCLVILTLLGNLYRTRFGKPGFRIAVEEAPHLVARLASQMGMRVTQPDPQSLTGLTPLPTFCDWTPSQLGRAIESKQPIHAMVSCDGQTANLLSCEPGWVVLPVQTLCDYSAVRWTFYALAVLLQDSVPHPDDGHFYGALAAKIKNLAAHVCPSHALLVAAQQLDHQYLSGESGGATNMVRLLHRLHQQGQLPVTMVTDGVEIQISNVMTALTTPALTSPNIARMTRILAEARMLIRQTPTSWVINGDIWQLVTSNLFS